VAQKINQFLQEDLLYNETVIIDSTRIFAASRYINEDTLMQSGLSEIDFTVVANNARLLSIQFDLESIGAYATNYNSYYNFDTQTGMLITSRSLFTPQGLKTIKHRLLVERKKRVANQFIALKEDQVSMEDSSYIRERFEECLTYTEDDENKILIKNGFVTFYKGFCFPHIAQPYETDLDIEISLRELDPFLSDYGKKLLGK